MKKNNYEAITNRILELARAESPELAIKAETIRRNAAAGIPAMVMDCNAGDPDTDGILLISGTAAIFADNDGNLYPVSSARAAEITTAARAHAGSI